MSYSYESGGVIAHPESCDRVFQTLYYPSDDFCKRSNGNPQQRNLSDYGGNLETYWQANKEYLLIERDLEDLVVCQFNRLQQLNLMPINSVSNGCYRYQDVLTVPEEGLFCLLWDVPEAQRRRVVKSLRDRSLVEFRNGEYWLHPVIRAEAIARLRASEDWDTVNHKAAEFWTESIKNS
jgi:hypothetical protein